MRKIYTLYSFVLAAGVLLTFEIPALGETAPTIQVSGTLSYAKDGKMLPMASRAFSVVLKAHDFHIQVEPAPQDSGMGAFEFRTDGSNSYYLTRYANFPNEQTSSSNTNSHFVAANPSAKVGNKATNFVNEATVELRPVGCPPPITSVHVTAVWLAYGSAYYLQQRNNDRISLLGLLHKDERVMQLRDQVFTTATWELSEKTPLFTRSFTDFRDFVYVDPVNMAEQQLPPPLNTHATNSFFRVLAITNLQTFQLPQQFSWSLYNFSLRDAPPETLVQIVGTVNSVKILEGTNAFPVSFPKALGVLESRHQDVLKEFHEKAPYRYRVQNGTPFSRQELRLHFLERAQRFKALSPLQRNSKSIFYICFGLVVIAPAIWFGLRKLQAKNKT